MTPKNEETWCDLNMFSLLNVSIVLPFRELSPYIQENSGEVIKKIFYMNHI